MHLLHAFMAVSSQSMQGNNSSTEVDFHLRRDQTPISGVAWVRSSNEGRWNPEGGGNALIWKMECEFYTANDYMGRLRTWSRPPKISSFLLPSFSILSFLTLKKKNYFSPPHRLHSIYATEFHFQNRINRNDNHKKKITTEQFCHPTNLTLEFTRKRHQTSSICLTLLQIHHTGFTAHRCVTRQASYTWCMGTFVSNFASEPKIMT